MLDNRKKLQLALAEKGIFPDDEIVDKIEQIYTDQQYAINGVVDCVYVVTYNDDYGRPIFDNCFWQKKIAEDYVKDHDYLRMDNTTVIKEVEFQ